MKVIQRIRFPRDLATTGLYFTSDQPVSILQRGAQPSVELGRGEVLSLNTYMNSFFEKQYAQYTCLKALYYELKLEGDFKIRVYRRRFGVMEDHLSEHIFEDCSLARPVRVSLPELNSGLSPGRIYLELQCLGSRGLFGGGVLATDQESSRRISLAIIICTYKRDEDVKETVRMILEDSQLTERDFKIFIVDNGRTLAWENFMDDRVILIKNRNVGGAGGFARGMIAALEEDHCTHFLLMDDDTEVESEALFRLFSLREYENQDYAVTGNLLDRNCKNSLISTGGRYGVNLPLELVQIKNGVDLLFPVGVDSLLNEENPNFGGWWFFSFSRELLRKVGLPMPFFVRGDDIEFGLRIHHQCPGYQIITFPTLAVWHMPDYGKHNTVCKIYYANRNRLITNAIHLTWGYWPTVSVLSIKLFSAVWVFDYQFADILMRSFIDYLKGPRFLKEEDAEKLHDEIVKNGEQSLRKSESCPMSELMKKFKRHPLKTLVRLLTLNGHLLLNGMMSEEPVYLQGYGEWRKAFLRKHVIFYNRYLGTYCEYHMDRRLGIKLLVKWILLVIKGMFKKPWVNAAWKNSLKEFSSLEFWKNYLGLVSGDACAKPQEASPVTTSRRE
ncbi:MAG: glycosyltransferase family 2 protein [Candidatus Omnitrophica bacterium]|nr:glycosyltransferase family 2 protein [Candidatus Omnitrophota bacterium]